MVLTDPALRRQWAQAQMSQAQMSHGQMSQAQMPQGQMPQGLQMPMERQPNAMANALERLLARTHTLSDGAGSGTL